MTNEELELDHITASCVPSQKQLNAEAEEAIKGLEDLAEEQERFNEAQEDHIREVAGETMQAMKENM